MLTERRQSPRARCLFGGFASFDNGKASVDCQVRNLSADGAQLTFAAGAMVPSTFKLQVAQLGLPVHAEILWRAGHRCGVAFSSGVDLRRRSPLDLAGRLAAYRPPAAGLRLRSA